MELYQLNYFKWYVIACEFVESELDILYMV
jgi:hypothetical protein